MDIFARASLIAAAPAGSGVGPAVVLEGAWHDSSHGQDDPAAREGSNRCARRRPCWSLDETLDASYGWIDDEAIRLAAEIAAQGNASAPASPSFAYVQERKLRYYLAKLLRVVAFFNHPPDGFVPPQGEVRAHLVTGRDDDYASLLSLLATRHRWQLQIIWHHDEPQLEPHSKPSLWRRTAGWLHRWTVSRSGAAGPRLVLCGNASGLDPLCEQLLARHSRVAWLYDEFCVRTWRRWRRDGVQQLLCRTQGMSATPSSACWMPPSVEFDGLDLTPALAPWLRNTAAAWEMRADVMARRIARQLRRFRPAMLVVDEDQTPLPRIAVWVARQLGIQTAVVQHGVPRVAFGFAPLAADWFLAWGEASRRQLQAFGYPGERIAVTGSARHDCLAQAFRWQPATVAELPREVLFFATTPPNDARPEPMRFRMTSAEHDRLVRMALREVAQLGLRLVIKTHPRAPHHAAALGKLLAELPQLQARIITGGNLPELCATAACAISLASGAGIDAAALGVPVVELVPRGAADLMPATEWGTWTTASDAETLRAFFRQAGLTGAPLQEPPHSLVRDISRVFANWGDAASATADIIVSLALGEQPNGPHGLHIPRPQFAAHGAFNPPHIRLPRSSQQKHGARNPGVRSAQQGPRTP